MELQRHLSDIAIQLVHEIEPVLKIKAVTSNTDLLGKYAEASVRRLAHRIVAPSMHVSSGTVIDFPIAECLPQVDMIIWAPYPSPAIFEVENFAVVPRSSAFGVVEIKRSNYGVEDKVEQFLADAPAL